ncbi:hypothetical protein [Pseudomonas putida]|uniref:hypothetical protein n=1 Tax=Pseudomonas putida TaxID=303 RepID=UPI002022F2D0|nr:hypothetical protein [Pseudomonas putida]MCL8307647.1 hypothetical protein [Pseudomonas putida]
MCPYFLNYLQWVFPVVLKTLGENAAYNDVLYSDSRALFLKLFYDYSYLGEGYYNARVAYDVKKLSQVCQGDDEFVWKTQQEFTFLAFKNGFESRVKRIFLVMGAELNDWYYYLFVNDIGRLEEIVVSYVTDTYKILLVPSHLGGVMKSFVERHRDEFIKRFEQQQPELAEILRELDWPSERDKFFSGDEAFKKELLERLNSKGKGHLLEHILGKDLGL